MAQVKRKETQATKRRKSRIPVFKTIEEEAEFWDTHDLTELEDELEDVTGQIRFIVTRGGPKKRLTIRLDVDTLAQLEALARSLDLRPATLARLWLHQRLHTERTRAQAGRKG